MTQYKKYIQNLAKENKDAVFFNSSSIHASLVMSTIFENAKDYIKIYAGSFSGEVSSTEEYRTSLENFLRRGGKLEILLQKNKFNESPAPEIFNLLKFYKIVNPNQVEVKIHPFVVSNDKAKKEIHFTVADGKMYRREDDILNFTAEGNFNDIIETASMVEIFDTIFNKNESVTYNLIKD